MLIHTPQHGTRHHCFQAHATNEAALCCCWAHQTRQKMNDNVCLRVATAGTQGGIDASLNAARECSLVAPRPPKQPLMTPLYRKQCWTHAPNCHKTDRHQTKGGHGAFESCRILLEVLTEDLLCNHFSLDMEPNVADRNVAPEVGTSWQQLRPSGPQVGMSMIPKNIPKSSRGPPL